MLVLAGGSRRAWRAPGRVLAGWRAGCDSRLRAGSEIGVWHGLGRLRFQSPELHLSNGCRGVRGAREKRSASGPGPPGFGMDDDRTKPNNSHTDAASALGDMLPSCPRGRMLGGVLAVLRLHLVATALAVCGGVGWMAGGRLNWLAGDGGRLVWWFESGLETVASIASWDPKMDLSGGVSTAPEGGATAWSAGMHSSPAAQQAARQGDRGAGQPPNHGFVLATAQFGFIVGVGATENQNRKQRQSHPLPSVRNSSPNLGLTAYPVGILSRSHPSPHVRDPETVLGSLETSSGLHLMSGLGSGHVTPLNQAEHHHHHHVRLVSLHLKYCIFWERVSPPPRSPMSMSSNQTSHMQKRKEREGKKTQDKTKGKW